MKLTLHLRIAGRVQGIGFREAMRAEAQRLGVDGWVRNRRDGSVEAVLQGSRESVDALAAWAREGPPAARVTRVETLPVSPELDRSYAGFERWPSA